METYDSQRQQGLTRQTDSREYHGAEPDGAQNKPQGGKGHGRRQAAAADRPGKQGEQCDTNQDKQQIAFTKNRFPRLNQFRVGHYLNQCRTRIA